VSDPQIVFLLSLPRAGSTLLQRLLIASGACRSVGEPSFLLRLLGEGDPILRAASYNEALVETAFEDLRGVWSGIDEAWREGVRELAMRVYRGIADGRPLVVDKTPRYSAIADELLATFPEARFVVLWRHPVAVAHSMSTTYRKGRWAPESFELDLCHGLERMRAVVEKAPERVHALRYEDLVARPEEELRRLGGFLGIEGLEAAARAELQRGNEGRLGDPTGVRKYDRVSTASVDAWEGAIRNWYRARWVRRYFDGERAEWLRSLGYEPPRAMSEGRVPLGLIDGVRDWLYARRVVRRRILRPLGSRGKLRREARRRGFWVTFR